MKFQLTALLAAAAAVCASAAVAAEPVVAKLQSPVEGVKKPIAGGAVFVCEADSCTAGNPTGGTMSTSGCRQLARAVGQIAAFGAGDKQLSDEKLAACNASARK